MKKKICLLALTAVSAVAISGAIVFGSKSKSFKALGLDNTSSTIWGHYEEVDASLSSYGCKEFWVSCDTHEILFEKPTVGIIEERGKASSEQIETWFPKEDGRTEKKLNSIIGMNDSYTTYCKTMPSLTGISASNGTVKLEILDNNNSEVLAENLTASSYKVKASVEGTTYYEGASKEATLTVQHESKSVSGTSAPTDRLGGKLLTVCNKCGEELTYEPNYGFYKGWGMGPLFANSSYPGTTSSGDGLGDYPEYTGSGEWGTYRVWDLNNNTSNMSLPRVDFRVFNNVSLILHTNCTSVNKIGFGYAENNDLMGFIDRGDHIAFALNASYDKTNKVLKCTFDSSAGESSSFEITSQSIIKGDSSINLKIQGGAWRSVVFHDFMLNHNCSNFGESRNITNSTCHDCFKTVSITENNFAYTTTDFAKDKYGISAEGDGFVTQIDTGEDVGAIKLGQPSSQKTGTIHLALATYSNVNNVVYYFSCNAAGSKIGFDNQNYVETVSNTKSANKSTVKFEMNDDVLRVTINVNGNTVSKDITDQDIINGKKPMDLFVQLNAWHYIAISKIVVNEIVE